MTSCTYNALCATALVLSPVAGYAACELVKTLVYRIGYKVSLPNINLDWLGVGVPVAATIAAAFIMLHTLPQKVEIISCRTHERITSIVLKDVSCSIKKV